MMSVDTLQIIAHAVRRGAQLLPGVTEHLSSAGSSGQQPLVLDELHHLGQPLPRFQVGHHIRL